MTYAFTHATVDEFETGAWIADLKSMQSFGGSGTFTLPDGSVWTGTALSERQEFDLYHTRVIGGAGKLGAPVLDKYYQGNVTAQVALGDICTEAKERAGTIPSGLVLNTLQRQAGIAAEALQSLADVFDFLWWIDRAGTVNMGAVRAAGKDATGIRVSSDSDGSATITQPVGVAVGVGYATGQQTAIPVIRHVRWSVTPQAFSAHIFPYPFLFTPPAQTKYDRPYDAIVTADNGDGTVDVKADVRPGFGVSKVRILSGVPGSKITMHVGDEVTLGFLAGDPRKPYCVAMVQNRSATKQVARNTDPVKVTITADQLTLLALEFVSPSGPCVYTPGGAPPPTPPGAPGLDVTGTIQGGTARISVGD